MKIPKTIKICGFDWEIIESQDVANSNENFGETHYRNQKIFIEPSEKQQKKEQVLLHEIIHAIFWQTGMWQRLKNKDYNPDEEEISQSISFMLYQVLKENSLYFGGAE
jgi:Zn-dependent peptidase ImmA (M78 family)